MPSTLIAPVGSITPMRAVRIETTDDIVRAAAAQFEGCIKAEAKQLAAGSRELRKDLEQEALILLWELDPTRFDASDRGYLRTAIRQRMRDVLREEKRLSGGGRRLKGSLSARY